MEWLLERPIVMLFALLGAIGDAYLIFRLWRAMSKDKRTFPSLCVGLLYRAAHQLLAIAQGSDQFILSYRRAVAQPIPLPAHLTPLTDHGD